MLTPPLRATEVPRRQQHTSSSTAAHGCGPWRNPGIRSSLSRLLVLTREYNEACTRASGRGTFTTMLGIAARACAPTAVRDGATGRGGRRPPGEGEERGGVWGARRRKHGCVPLMRALETRKHNTGGEGRGHAACCERDATTPMMLRRSRRSLLWLARCRHCVLAENRALCPPYRLPANRTLRNEHKSRGALPIAPFAARRLRAGLFVCRCCGVAGRQRGAGDSRRRFIAPNARNSHSRAPHGTPRPVDCVRKLHSPARRIRCAVVGRRVPVLRPSRTAAL